MSNDSVANQLALQNLHRNTVMPNACTAIGVELVKKHQAYLSLQLENFKKSAAKYASKSNANQRLLQEVFSLSAHLRDYLDGCLNFWALLHTKMDDYLQDSLPQIQSSANTYGKQFAEYTVNVHAALNSHAAPLLFAKSFTDSPQVLEQQRNRLLDACADATHKSFSPTLLQGALLHTLNGQLSQFYANYLINLLESTQNSYVVRLDMLSKLMTHKTGAIDESLLKVDLTSLQKMQKDVYIALKPITLSSDTPVTLIEKAHSSAHHITSSTSLNNLSISTASLAVQPNSPVQSPTIVNPLNSSGTHIVPMRAGSIAANPAMVQQIANLVSNHNANYNPQLPSKPANANSHSLESSDLGADCKPQKVTKPTLESKYSSASGSSEQEAVSKPAKLASATRNRPSNRKSRRPGAQSSANASSAHLGREDSLALEVDNVEEDVVDFTNVYNVDEIPRATSFTSAHSTSSLDSSSADGDSMEKQIKKKRPVTLAAGGALAALAGIMSQGLRTRQNNSSQENLKSCPKSNTSLSLDSSVIGSGEPQNTRPEEASNSGTASSVGTGASQQPPRRTSMASPQVKAQAQPSFSRDLSGIQQEVPLGHAQPASGLSASTSAVSQTSLNRSHAPGLPHLASENASQGTAQQGLLSASNAGALGLENTGGFHTPSASMNIAGRKQQHQPQLKMSSVVSEVIANKGVPTQKANTDETSSPTKSPVVKAAVVSHLKQPSVQIPLTSTPTEATPAVVTASQPGSPIKSTAAGIGSGLKSTVGEKQPLGSPKSQVTQNKQTVPGTRQTAGVSSAKQSTAETTVTAAGGSSAGKVAAKTATGAAAEGSGVHHAIGSTQPSTKTVADHAVAVGNRPGIAIPVPGATSRQGGSLNGRTAQGCHSVSTTLSSNLQTSPQSGSVSPKKELQLTEEFIPQKSNPEKRWMSDIDAVMKGRARSSSLIKKPAGGASTSGSGSGSPQSQTASPAMSPVHESTLPGAIPLAKGLDLRKKAGSISGNDEAASRQAQLWMNRHLAPKTVENPFDNMSDGLLLIEVMEKISPGMFPKYNKRPILTAQKMDNLNLLLSVLKDKGINVLCDADDLLRGDKFRILGLVLAIMRKYP